jgi:pimeloyl-ACP methyl ester carboxylesterase
VPARQVDFIEAGSGAPVILVHSSVSGARQWRRLMEDLQADFLVRAVNLFGYGKTPQWSSDGAQRLEDQAALVEAALPPDAEKLCLVGHSFGGSVAMKVAARLSQRVRRLVLLEPNPFYLLRQAGHAAAFAEIMALRNLVKTRGALGTWSEAAEGFADYWGGTGTWQKMPVERRDVFAEGLKPVFFEWDAVMNETLTATQWAELLPRATLLASDPNTVRPIREITALLRQACPFWTYQQISAGGHMAPLSRPDLVNPIVRSFLLSGRAAAADDMR